MCSLHFFVSLRVFWRLRDFFLEASLDFIAKLMQYPPEKLTYSLKIQGWKKKCPFEMVPFQAWCQVISNQNSPLRRLARPITTKQAGTKDRVCVGWVFCCATEVDLRTSPSKKWRPKSRKLTRTVFVGEHMKTEWSASQFLEKLARFKSDGSASIGFWWYTIWIHVLLYPWVACPFLGGFVRIPNQQASLSIITGGLKFS